MNMDYGVRDVVLYVAKRLRCFSRVDKLMNIIFLAQYDVERRAVYEYRCGGRPLARAEFYLWSTGVVSDEIYDAIGSIDFDLVSRELGLEFCYGGPMSQLPQPVAARLSEVVERYGGWKPWQLRLHVKELLGLDVPERLSDYAGYQLYTYLRAEGFHMTAREVCI
jgi:uncharacterized phage-associated protein